MGIYQKELASLISEYRKLPLDSNKKKELHERIVSIIREIVYFMPQQYFGLRQEDCAELLLLFEGRIENTINSYDISNGDFISFIYPSMERIIKGLKKKHCQQSRKEDSILHFHSSYEFIQKEQDNSTENLVVSEDSGVYSLDDNLVIKRIMYILSQNKKAQRRLFVFFITYSVLMTTPEINRFCSTFKFDFYQTMRIVEQLKKSDIIKDDQIRRAIEKRNDYFSKQIYIQNELAFLNYLSDHSKDSLYTDYLNRYRVYSKNQDTIIRRRNKRVPRSTLSEVLNTSNGTIAVYLYFSKNLLEWCLNADSVPNPPYKALGISEAVLKTAKDNNAMMKFNKDSLKLFDPFTSFKINLS